MSIDNGFRPRFGGDDDVERPSVAMPARRWVAPLGILASVLLGVVVFWALNENRTRVEARLTDPAPNAQPASMDDIPPPPPMTMAQATETAQTAGLPVSDAALPPPPPPQNTSEADARLRSPSLVVDLSEAAPPAAPGAAQGQGLAPGAVASALSPRTAGASAMSSDERFAERFGVGGTEGAARATRLSNQGFMIVQGAMIPAVLETAVNSDLPGYVRAVVSRDVRSFDGARVLVPRGTRLVGQYRSGVALGQSRAFVIWTRLIRPDGVNVELAAPATDALGRGGLEGRVDRHFLQRFGGAILLSLITAGAQIAANDNSDTQVIIAATRGATTDAASVALQKDLDIAPTVKVPQGAPIRIFVTRDLDFSVLAEDARQ